MSPPAEVLDVGLPRTYLRCCLALLVAEAPAHGYQLMERIEQLGARCGDCGYVYRLLRTMEADAHVASQWEDSTAGPARRTYRLTNAGADWLRLATASLTTTRDHLGNYLHRHRRLVEPTSQPQTA